MMRPKNKTNLLLRRPHYIREITNYSNKQNELLASSEHESDLLLLPKLKAAHGG